MCALSWKPKVVTKALSSARAEQPIRLEPEEAPSRLVTMVVGLQGAALIIAPTVLNVAVAIQASGLDDTYLAWAVFTALLTVALVTSLQAIQVWRFGAGHIVLSSPAALFIAIMVATITASGPQMFATLLVICCVVQIGLAFWLPTLRRIFTPVVTGTVTMLIAVSVLPIAFGSVQNVPEDASPTAGPLIAAVTVVGLVVMALRAKGLWRLAGPFISIAIGYAVAAAFGLIELERVSRATWFGIPAVPELGFDLTFGPEFWALLPSFAILTLVLGIKTISDGVAIQQGSRRIPRAIDFRQIQGMVSVNGLGMLFSGLAGTLPPMAYSSFSLSLISLTGVAARRVGIGVGIAILTFAFFGKFTALLLTIPGPVLGAYLMLAMGMLFVSGLQTILRDGLDQKRVIVVGLASALGLGLHNHPVMVDIFGQELGSLLGNGVTIGAVVAIGLTLLFESISTRRPRLEVTLNMDSLPALNSFLDKIAADLKWNDSSALRLNAVGEEALLSLQIQDDHEREPENARLIVNALPQPTMVELEFIATTQQENIEDQLANLSDQVQDPASSDLSLRLLRHYSSGLSHQKFHGVDILVIKVEGGP